MIPSRGELVQQIGPGGPVHRAVGCVHDVGLVRCGSCRHGVGGEETVRAFQLCAVNVVTPEHGEIRRNVVVQPAESGTVLGAVGSGAGEIQRALLEARGRLRVVVFDQDQGVGVEACGRNAVTGEGLAGVGILDGAAASEIARELRGGGNDGRSRPGGLPDAPVFVREEEEQFITLDRTADGPAEIVVTVLGLGGGKEIAGVQMVVAEKFEQRAVEAVRSRTCDDVDLRAGIAAVLGGICVTLDSDFSDGVQVHHRQVVAVVGVDIAAAVQQPVVGAGLAAVKGKGHTGIRAETGLLRLAGIYAGLQRHQLRKASRGEREFLHLRTKNRGAHVGGGRVDLRDLGFHLYGFVDRADRHLDIHAQRLAGAEKDAGARHFAESGFLEFNMVFAGGDLHEPVVALGVRDGVTLEECAFACHTHRSVRHTGAARVFHGSNEGAGVEGLAVDGN